MSSRYIGNSDFAISCVSKYVNHFLDDHPLSYKLRGCFALAAIVAFVYVADEGPDPLRIEYLDKFERTFPKFDPPKGFSLSALYEHLVIDPFGDAEFVLGEIRKLTHLLVMSVQVAR